MPRKYKTKKIVVFTLILGLFIMPFLSGFSHAEILEVISDDNWVSIDGWSSAWWTLNDNSTDPPVNNNYIQAYINPNSQFESMQITGLTLNLTELNPYYIGFWYYCRNDSNQFRISLHTDDSNFYYAIWGDSLHQEVWDFTAWWAAHFWEDHASWITYGSPDPGNITKIAIMMNTNNANEINLYMDFLILGDGGIDVEPTPGPTPTATPTPGTTSNSIEIIYFYILIGWLIICLILGFKYWQFFGLIGGVTGFILLFGVMSKDYFITGYYMPSNSTTLITSYMAIGYLYWIPLLLIILNFVSPFLKNK